MHTHTAVPISYPVHINSPSGLCVLGEYKRLDPADGLSRHHRERLSGHRGRRGAKQYLPAPPRHSYRFDPPPRSAQPGCLPSLGRGRPGAPGGAPLPVEATRRVARWPGVSTYQTTEHALLPTVVLRTAHRCPFYYPMSSSALRSLMDTFFCGAVLAFWASSASVARSMASAVWLAKVSSRCTCSRASRRRGQSGRTPRTPTTPREAISGT